VRSMWHLPANRFLPRTDAKNFYASIDHDVSLDGLARAPGCSLTQSPRAPIPRYAALTRPTFCLARNIVTITRR
jgi:hypothetical protein